MVCNVERVPDSNNFFSEIQQKYPSHSFRLTQKDEVPAHINRGFRPPPVQHGGRGARTTERAAAAVGKGVISGPHRYKFFRRPIVPFLHSAPPEVLLAPAESAPQRQDPGGRSRAGDMVGTSFGLTREIGTQSVFRESETQTEPYTPDYVVRPGDEPEVLSLATLQYGAGLPAGQAEVEMIERARQKKEFESRLPPTTDQAGFELRSKMMEEQELREWQAREKEITRLQQERLQLLEHAIYERDRENEFMGEQRIEALRQLKLEQKEHDIHVIQQRRIKALRKLSKARKAAEPNGKSKSSRDIISQYENYGSKVYAPLLRSGQFPDRNAERFEVHPQDLKSIRGLQELEVNLPAALRSAIHPAIDDGKATVSSMGRGYGHGGHSSEARKKARIAVDLEMMDQLLKQRKAEAKAQDATDTSAVAVVKTEDDDANLTTPPWKKKQEKTARPATPRASAYCANDEVENAIILLQKLLRGRAVQNLMFEGKEKRLELIRELRCTEDEDPLVQHNDAIERKEAEREEASREAALDAIQGEVVGSMLDFLSNELVRANEEARVMATVRSAEELRRTREVSEGARRQVELEHRRRGDEVFHQVVRVHQGTVESFLDGCVASAIDHTSAARAISELKMTQTHLVPLIDQLVAEQKQGQETSWQVADAVITDLVSSFVLPEVGKKNVERLDGNTQQRLVNAAHSSLSAVHT